jgi:hypothetical protein
MFLFGGHQKQDKFVEFIANELALVAHSDIVKFYYGENSSIFTFKSEETIEEVDEFLNIVFNGADLVYILLPYLNDKMSFKLNEDICKHLFDLDNRESMSGFSPKAQESQIDELKNLKNELNFTNSFDDEAYEDDDEDEMVMLKNKKKEPSIDEMLDKISEKGLSSLTETERGLLEKYSKTI